jgi:acyl-CoA thioesterase-1
MFAGMIKRYVLVIVGVLALLGVTAYLCTRPGDVANYPSSGTTVIAFGDSLVQGVGSTPGNDFVSKASSRTGIPIINSGVSGNTTAQALARLDADVLSKDPKIVLVLLGGNDYLKRVPKEETFANLRTIVSRIQAKGAVVIILGVRAGLITDNYEDGYAEVADEYHAAYVPNVLEGLITDNRYMSDAIHPNDNGYAKIAERVAPVLERLYK